VVLSEKANLTVVWSHAFVIQVTLSVAAMVSGNWKS